MVTPYQSASFIQNNYGKNVLELGVKGDGVTDDTVAIQAALNLGINLYFPNGEYVITANITVSKNSGMYGSLAIPAMQHDNIYSNIGSTLILSASIILSPGSIIKDFNIVTPQLIAAMPYSSAAVAAATIAAYSGTAITATAPTAGSYGDIEVNNCAFAGFNLAISIYGYNRPRVQYNHIDCTNGIYIAESYDVAYVAYNCCIPFTTAVNNGGAPIPTWQNVTRSGTAYRTSGVVDTATFFDNFSFGYQVGFDIESFGSFTMIKCGADHVGWEGTAGNIGQIGFVFRGTNSYGTSTGVRMIACDAAAQDKGVLISGAVSILIEGSDFWGNAGHIKADQTTVMTLIGNTFRYLNGNWSFTAGVTISNTVTGAVVVQGNTFDNIYPSWGFNPSGSAQINICNNSYVNGAINSLSETLDLWETGTKENRIYRASADGSDIIYSKARGTFSSHTALLSSDIIWRILGKTYTGASFVPSSSIRASALGAASTSVVPTGLIFSTASALTLTDQWLIDPTGNLLPITTNSVSVGNSTNLVSAFWAANGTIQTSDGRSKTEINESKLGLDFVLGLRPVSFKFKEGGRVVTGQNYVNNSVPGSENNELIPSDVTFETKPGNRTHWGFIAQEVKALADTFGVDFGGFVQADISDPDSLQALRYDEFVAPIVMAIKELSMRLAILENKKAQNLTTS